MLPEPLFGSEWEEAEMYIPSQIASFDKSWKEINTSVPPSLNKFSGWFDTVMTSSKEGASFSFGFEGDMIGLFDIGGPEVGQVEVLIDGKFVRLKEVSTKGFHLYEANDRIGNYTLNRFNSWCNNRYRGQYDVIKLKKGVHQVTIGFPGKSSAKVFQFSIVELPTKRIKSFAGGLMESAFRLISPYHPKQIFVYEGDNDIGYQWTPDEILEQIKRLFFILRKEKPEAEIIFISIKPSVRRLKDKELFQVEAVSTPAG